MAKTSTRRRVASPPFELLERPLTPRERARVAATTQHLTRWFGTLGTWRLPEGGPHATTFVSIYTRGTLRGCYGMSGIPPRERLARAFLRAAHDGRFATLGSDDARDFDVQVSFPVAARPLEMARAAEQIEPGRDGLVLMPSGKPGAVLLPLVARDGQLTADAFLAALARKAGLPRDQWRGAQLWAFHTDDVVVRARGPKKDDPRDSLQLAAGWMSRQIDGDGQVRFAVDPKSRRTLAPERMYHGRAAVLVRALATIEGFSAKAGRARRWLQREIAKATRGSAPPGWPDDAAMVAGTLALAQMAGVDAQRDLEAIARAQPQLSASSWHAAQVCAALGSAAPAKLWQACVADLETRPWAPWTLLAARARADGAVIARCEKALVESVRLGAPHEGGVGITPVPEVALTAVTVEALAGTSSREGRAAIARARRFLEAWQFTGERVPAALDHASAVGAFPASPVAHLLRCDIVGHAVLALV